MCWDREVPNLFVLGQKSCEIGVLGQISCEIGCMEFAF